MGNEMITAQLEGDVFFIALNRPEKRNAIPVEMMWELGEAIERAGAERKARSVIIRGEGKCFSSGIDLNSLAQIGGLVSSPPEFRAILTRMQGVFNRMEMLEKPVICAMHCMCIGMAMELALAADFRIAAEGTVFSIPEAALGLIPDVGGTSRLTKIVGPAHAKELILLCRKIDAARAREIGLVTEVSPEGQLMEAALSMAAEAAAAAPLAVGIAKKIINRGAHLDTLTFQELEAYAQSALIGTDDVKEGIMAKAQKRPPQFKGK